MSRSKILATVAIALTLMIGDAHEPSDQPGLATARRRARRQNRPLMVFVCEPCSTWSDAMESRTLRHPRVSKVLRERFVFVKMLCKDEHEYIAKRKIQVFPTTLFESASGDPLGVKHVGYLDVDGLLELLQKALKSAETKSRKH